MAGFGREIGALMAGIAKVATRLRLGDPDPDAGFWCSRPAAERIAHVRGLPRRSGEAEDG